MPPPPPSRRYAPLAVLAILAMGALAWRFVLARRSVPSVPAVATTAAHALRIGVPTSCYAGLLAVAKQRGLFTKAGLAVDFVPLATGRIAFGKMLAGDLDATVVSDLPVAFERLTRADFAVLAVLSRSTFDHWVIARPGIAKMIDLKGKRVAVQKRRGTQYILETYLTDVGLAPTDVELVDTPEEDVVRELLAGHVDALVVGHDYSGSSRERFKADVVELHDPAAYRLTSMLVASRKVLEGARAPINELVGALVDAADLWTADPDRGAGDVADALGVERSKAVAQCKNLVFAVTLDPAIAAALHGEVAWFSQHGESYGAPVPDTLTLFAAEPLRTARASAVHLGP